MNAPDNWNLHWSQFAQSSEHNPAQLYRFRVITELIEQQPYRPNHIIDVGCGTGSFLDSIRKTYEGVNVIGIEPSEKGAEIAKNRLGRENVIHADLTDGQLDLSSLDGSCLVVCSEVLEHLDDPVALLRAIRASFGSRKFVIVISVPGGIRTPYDKHIGHRDHFTKERLRLVLESAGYGSLTIYRSGFPFFNLYKIAVALLGRRLVERPNNYSIGLISKLNVGRALFYLMKFSSRDSVFGWQIFATASNL